jgi:hypothetical protein
MDEPEAYWAARKRRNIRGLLILWSVLLVPWLPFALLSGLAFDGGPTPQAYFFVWSVLSYPVAVGIAVLSRKRFPVLLLLPFLNLIGFILSGARSS